MANGNNHETAGRTISFELQPTNLQNDEARYHRKEEYILGSVKFLHLDSSDMGYRDRDFIIIDVENDPARTFEYFTRKWNLGAPKLVISLIGGYRGIKHVTSGVKKTFRRQLVNAVLSTGAWLTTGGMHSGMTKDVGEALRDYAIGRAMAEHRSIVTLGIVPLSILKHQQKLKAGQKPAKYKIDPSDVIHAQLDPNHTHFIIVNDESDLNAGVEMDVQSKLLREITTRNIEGSTAGVPVVCIVIGGGYKRIKAVHQAVMSKIPVIILENTGGAADVLAFACANMKDTSNDRLGKSLSHSLSRTMIKTATGFMKILRSEFGAEKIKTVDGEIALQCRQIADSSNLVTVLSFNALHGANIIEDTILNALLKAKTSQHGGDQLHLAAVLNRIDLAQRLMEQDTCMKVTEVRQTLRFALINNQVKLVRLFLNKGVSLYEYLTVRELTSLYKTIDKDTLLYDLLDDELEKRGRSPVQKWVNLRDVGNVLRKLTPWSYRPLYLREEISDKSDRFPDPSRELFLWAILQGRLEIAQLFWREGKASIGGALVASQLLKELAVKEYESYESRRLTKYEEGGRLYEELAVGVLDECYLSDRKRTSLIIVRRLEKWGSSTCLDLANSASNMKFIAHSAVQNMLKEFWMGKLSLSNPRWKIWVCMMFPLVLPCIHLKLKEEEVDPLLVKSLPRGLSKGTILIRKPVRRTSTTGRSRRWGLTFPRKTPSRDETGDGPTTPQPKDSEPNFKGRSALNRRRAMKVDEKDTEDTTRPHVSTWKRIKAFFLVPFVIFYYNVLSIGTFLGLFSYILLVFNFDEIPEVQPVEYVLLFWFGTLCTEYIRQIHHEDAETLGQRLKSWISNFWNIVDIAKSVVFIIGYVLRFVHNTDTRSAARIILSLALILFYMRVLHIFSANKHLGPKLIMIQKMFADLLIFIVLLFVFLIAYGVSSEAILNPGRTNTKAVLESIFYRPYIQMFGEMLLEDADNSECKEDCPDNVWYGTILLAVYLFLSNVLLLNLLIAMFNYTFTAVQENTDVYWKYQRYKLIREYYKRPPLPPPFIIISHIYLLIVLSFKNGLIICTNCRKSIYCTCCRPREKYDPGLPSLTQASINEMTIWESVKGEDYLSKEHEEHKRDVNKILKHSDRRILQLTDHMTKLQEDMSLVQEQLENMQSLLVEKLGPSQQLASDEEDLKLIPDSPNLNLRKVALLATSRLRVPMKHQANLSDMSDDDEEIIENREIEGNVG